MTNSRVVPTHKVRARKSLGQHWLADTRAIRRIADAVGAGPGDTVVEVGPGTGRLTAALDQSGARILAVEIDDDLVPALRERFAHDAVTVVNADVMQLSPAELLEAGGAERPYFLTGNLPYYIGTAVIRHFLYSEAPPERMVVMLQAEVAENVAAGAGDRGYLSVLVQALADARLLWYLPPSAFKPPPKVRSAVVRLDLRDPPLVAHAEGESFLEFAQAGFAAPRKTLRNSLAVGLRIDGPTVDSLLTEAVLEAKQRPADVEVADWVRLFGLWRARS